MKRLAAVALAFLTACSSSAADTTTDPTAGEELDALAPSSTTSTIGSLTKADIEQLISDIGPITELDQTRQVVEVVGLVNEPALLPYLFDAGRFGGTEVLTEAMRIMARVTGESPPSGDLGAQWRFYGSWLMDNGVDPGPGYIPWKAALYANIDAEFQAMLASIDDPLFASQVHWGGVRRGGIPELNDAQTISVADADYMLDDELVFGTVINGQARAYPVRILGHHELANDTLGGEEVSLAYCTLCRTPVLFSGEAAGMVLDFQTSGLLHNSNKVMVDNQTNSLWNQLTGEAFAGPLKGEQLSILPMTVTTWGDWVADHPDTDVQTVPPLLEDDDGLFPTGGYSYEPGDAYAGYYAGDELWFPAFDVPDVFDDKTEVVTLNLDDAPFAAELGALLEAGGLITEVGGRAVVFVASGNGARAYESVDGLDITDGVLVFAGEPVSAGEEAIELPDGTRLARIVSGQSFWFAWAGNHPNTEWWPTS
jgi:hypothetical protein